MYPRIRECLTDFMDHLERLAQKRAEINLKDMYGNYTMDVIATTAFATNTDVHKSLDNPFVVNARNLLNLNPIKRIALLMLPSVLQQLFGLSQSESREFFVRSIRQIMANRKKIEAKKYNDFLQLLIDCEKQNDIIRDENDKLDSHHINEGEEELSAEKKALNINIVDKHLTDNEVMAQAIVFLLGGYETTSNLLSFCSYELALNPHIQDILCNEINCAIDSNGEIPYEVLAKLPHLDAVISETLRLHSPFLRLSRLATTDYPLADTGITLRAGQQIDFPIQAIHRSEEYYENAHQFNPDRFMPENRHKIIPYTYLPFGAGPRNCIGMRFALLNAKLALAHIVKNYTFFPTPNTDRPIHYMRGILNLTFPQKLIVGIDKRC
ncbi:unnamed protein product [Medioppia subpectinata]|uniref:Cytochrome P450 n=1 Tax=Medioppia subpectinata TaxID=1979941 RepID=A0A7R9Q3R9_9ACAR|nr:unnamed protein product [Medioppia subpectinata]CAG2111767.1 unnamed protein product [Medioppia subpectinata]